MNLAQTQNNMKNYGVICDVGGKIKGNQDSAFFTKFDLIIAPGSPDSKSFAYPGILSLICDGVTASSHGEKGSTFVIRNLSTKILSYLYSNNFKLTEIHQNLQKFIKQTNEELIEQFQKEISSGKIPKTTLVGILVIGQWLWVFNIGDSRAFLIKDDKINQISIDDIGTGAMHEITQALGETNISPHLQVFNWAFENNSETKNCAFKNSFYFLICSDGLTDKVSPSEIKTAFLENKDSKSMQNVVQNLFQLTMDRNIDDNVSIIAVDLANYYNSLNLIQILKLSLPTNNKMEKK